MDGDPIAPGDAQVLKLVGEMIGSVLQLCIGQSIPATDERHLVREPAGAVMKKVLNEDVHLGRSLNKVIDLARGRESSNQGCVIGMLGREAWEARGAARTKRAVMVLDFLLS